MKKSKEKIKGSIEKNYNLMSTPLMSILPGQISFFVVLSIIPLASIFMMIISKLSLNYDAIANAINHYIPPTIASVILSILEQQRVGALDLFFIITAFYLASKATHSIIVASTQIYNGKQKDFITTRIKAILLLIVLVTLIVVLVGALAIGSKLANYLSDTYQAIHPIVYLTYTILKWPFVFFMVFFAIKVIYTTAPNVNIPSRSVNRGALLTTIVWIVSTYAFSFYATNFANYDKFYGNLSNLIILMIWIYWLCYIFVYGMTINHYILDKNNEKKEKVLK